MDGVLRAAARMLGGVPRYGHIIDYMIDFFHIFDSLLNCLVLCFWHCTYLPPGVLHPDFSLLWYTIFHLCLSSRGDFEVPQARMAMRQYRAFSTVGPSAWNSLPSELRPLTRDLFTSFYKHLKTFLYALGRL